MMENIDKDLFELMAKNVSGFGLFVSASKLITEKQREAAGKENMWFYEVLRDLMYSINNAGWESRHSEQINMINNAMDRISQNFDEFLP